MIIKVGQTLYVQGQHGSIGELGVLYFTQIHQYGHVARLWGYVPLDSAVGGGQRRSNVKVGSLRMLMSLLKWAKP